MIALYTVPADTTREVLHMRTLLQQFNSAWTLLEEDAGNGPYSRRLDLGHFCDFFQRFLLQGLREEARHARVFLGSELPLWRHCC